MANTSTSHMPSIEWNCVYCGRRLGGFALSTQVVPGPLDGIDYCRKCSAEAASDRLGIPQKPVLGRWQHTAIDE
jgi:hypothetical protein